MELNSIPLLCDNGAMTVPPLAGATPQVSIVVVTGDRHHRTCEGMAGIFAQAGIEECEVILMDGSPGDHAELYARFRGVRYFHGSISASLSRHRMNALKLTRAPIVAFLEDHVVPEAGWLTAVRAAFASSDRIAMVNYSFATTPSAGYVFRALQMTQYGHWMVPVQSGPIRYACLQNLAYRRDLIANLPEEDAEMFETEFLLHRRFLAQGWTLWLAAGAVIDHENYNDFLVGCKGFGALRQMMGAGRAKLYGWSLGKRLLWAAAMPLTPPILTWRLARSIAPRPALWGEFLRSLPVGIASQVWGATQEARGYLCGFQRSREEFLEFESFTDRAL